MPGSWYWTRLWWVSSVSPSTRRPVIRRTSTAAPGPERALFLKDEVAAPAALGVLGPHAGHAGESIDLRAVSRHAQKQLDDNGITAKPVTLLRDLPVSTRTQIVIA